MLRAYEGSVVTITTGQVPKTMPYDVVIRYETKTPGDWEIGYITIVRPDEYDPEGPCANAHPSLETNVPFVLPETRTGSVAISDICLERGKVYKVRITFERHRNSVGNPVAHIYVDSLLLVPRIEVTPILDGEGPSEARRREYIELGCNETYYEVNYEKDTRQECIDLRSTVSTYVFDGAIRECFITLFEFLSILCV